MEKARKHMFIFRMVCVILAIVTALPLCIAGCNKNKHVCESKCPTCGYCLNKECKEEVCEKKCLGHNEKLSVTDVEITTAPRTWYYVGEKFDVSDLKVVATLSTGKTKTFKGSKFTDYTHKDEALTAGVDKITLTVPNSDYTFDVAITVSEPTGNEMVVDASGLKSFYTTTEEIDFSVLSVKMSKGELLRTLSAKEWVLKINNKEVEDIYSVSAEKIGIGEKKVVVEFVANPTIKAEIAVSVIDADLAITPSIIEAEDCVYMLSDDRKETDSPFAGIQDMITCEYKEPEGWINQSRYLKTGASGKGSLWCLEEFQSGKNVYFKFKVSVPADGNYTIKARAQTVGERDISGKFAINVNNEKNADGTLKFHTETEKQMCAPCNQLELYCPNNTDVKDFTNYCNSFWWDSITVGTVSMKKGENEIRIYLPTGYPGNLDFFEVVSGKAVQETKVISVRSGSAVDLSKNALYLKKGEKLTDIVDTPERHPVKYTLLYIRTTSGKDVCVLDTMLEGKIDYDKIGEQTITVTDPVSGESASFKLIIES